MVNRKQIRKRGKIQLSSYFQELKKGDNVTVIKEKTLQPSFPTRIQGRSGIVEERRGKAYLVKIKDIDKEKKYLIEPIHLKKINN